MDRKNKKYIAIGMMALTVFIVAAVMLKIWNMPTTKIPIMENFVEEPGKVSARAGYTATIWQNSLAIFENFNMEKPLYISDISVNELIKSDFDKLKDGIHLENKEEISRLLEDFES